MSIFVNKPVIVREVFVDNLEYEFMLIQSALNNYPFVSMDTEFPGTIFKPDKNIVQLGNPKINYRFMKVNVDALKIIQLGLTLSDSEDRYDKESIELLKRQGIDLTRNKEKALMIFLLKILTQHPLPPDLKSFMRHMTYYFGCRIFDIKYNFKIFNLHGGLEKVAKTLNVARVAGLSHQAMPREEVLKEKGKDWKEIDEKLEAMKIKGTVAVTEKER
ncbi:hypothetical protein GOBAR_DD26543 [Gossypium barbadense]|nr:hypothetical protein GOBAR_DD26543 [Gossypium barbadense]